MASSSSTWLSPGILGAAAATTGPATATMILPIKRKNHYLYVEYPKAILRKISLERGGGGKAILNFMGLGTH